MNQPASGVIPGHDDKMPASTGPGDGATVQDADRHGPAPQQAGLQVIDPHVLPERGRNFQGGQGSPVGFGRCGVAQAAHEGQVIGVVRNPRRLQVGQGHGDRAGLALAPPLGPVARVELGEKWNREVDGRQWGHDQRD